MDGCKMSYLIKILVVQLIILQASLCKGKVAVFDQPSREDNMMLNIVNQGKPSPKEVAKHLLGESIYVAWPHLIEAK